MARHYLGDISLGRQASAGSQSVVLATDQASILITPSLPTVAGTSRVAINISASGDNTIVAAVTAQTIRVHKLFLAASGAVSIKFKDGASTDFMPAFPLQAYGGMVLDSDQDPWFVTTAGNALIINLSAAVQVSGILYYSQS